MSTLSFTARLAVLLVVGVSTFAIDKAEAQSITGTPPVAPPSPLAITPTADQQQALQNVTSAQSQTILSVITPQLQQQIQNHQQSTSQNFRSY